MLEISRLWVASFDLDRIDLFWEIQNTVEDHLLYSFYIERSESIAGPWTLIGGPFKDKWYFRDIQVNQRHRHRKYFYRIRIVEDATADTSYSSVSSRDALPDLVALEIMRRMMVLLKEKVGRTSFLFPARTFGTRCPNCWDKIRQKIMKDNCITCFGTGFAGGYMSPIEILIQIDPEAEASQATSSGDNADTKTTARMMAIPRLKPKDVIVEAENTRWVVMSVSSTQRLRAVVHQEVQLHQLQPGDIAYKVPVAVDEKNFNPSPGREFVEPQIVEELKTAEPSIDDVYRAYGFPFQR